MDTDRTQVKGGHSDLPVALSGPMVPEAHQRAPTLMAGARGGGEVRIWAPSKWRQWFRCGIIASCLAIMWENVLREVLLGRAGRLLFCSVVALIYSVCFPVLWRLMRRPRYAATDASGIAITTDSSSAAISLADIQSIRCSDASVTFFRLVDNTTQSEIRLDLAAYPKRSNKALVQLVIDRAGLYQNPFDSNEFLTLAEMARRGLELGEIGRQALPEPEQDRGDETPGVD